MAGMDTCVRSNLPRIGIFGTGWTARMLVPILVDNGFQVTAICGRKKEAAGRVGNDLNIPFRTISFQEFLLASEVDLVCIVSPPHTHAEMAVKALSAGKHVFCSFPMALTQSEAEKMVTAARYYPSLLAMCPNPLRHLPAFVKMKEMISQGFCGKLMVCEVVVRRGPLVHPKGFTWICDQTMGGGILSTVGSHVIDILMYLTSERIREVNGQVRTLVRQLPGKVEGFRSIDSDDFTTFTLCGDSGLHATVTLNSHVPNQFSQEMLMIGERGRLIVRGSELFAQASNEQRERLIVRDDSPGGAQCSSGDDLGMPSLLLRGTEQAVALMRRGFEASPARMQADRSMVATCSTFEDGLFVNAVIDAVNDSSASGRLQQIVVGGKESQRNPFWTSNGGDGDRGSPMPSSKSALS
ncbi:glucose-fructose oxidoreductase domain-containing protein 2-like [Sycon ciliatum]|uniref:glucose-fructose oxidoreductase domain-containing protein 2-like n=1 Tax=Sycon ciliatum TaxID=27933 RepID=UPI0020AED884|eukprot:scpid65869/ scgid31482/ Glucose-fructose oxidoreductase domain-containing protein 2